MDILSQMQLQNHEQVNFFHDPKTNLKAIIAIHSTELGPSLGGCRMMEYESDPVSYTHLTLPTKA